MSIFAQVFETDCRNCHHHIEQPFPRKGGSRPLEEIRIRCSQCHTTNYVTEDDD